MAGTMSLGDLATDLQGSLHDCAELFSAPDDFKRLLLQCVGDMAIKRPRTLLGQVTLEAGQPRYSVAAYPDFSGYKTHLWNWVNGCALQPWDAGYPGARPKVSASADGGAYWLDFSPAPTSKHIAALGSTFKFYYLAQHVLGEDAVDSTVMAVDRGLLLLRAQAEALREVTLNQLNKPIQLRDSLSGTPRNSTPAALHETLLRLFWEAR